jgi:DNA-binding GntR family transcriptional regulator
MTMNAPTSARRCRELLRRTACIFGERTQGIHRITLSTAASQTLTKARKLTEGAALRLSVARCDGNRESEVRAAHQLLVSLLLVDPDDPSRRSKPLADAHLAFHAKLIAGCGVASTGSATRAAPGTGIRPAAAQHRRGSQERDSQSGAGVVTGRHLTGLVDPHALFLPEEHRVSALANGQDDPDGMPALPAWDPDRAVRPGRRRDPPQACSGDADVTAARLASS